MDSVSKMSGSSSSLSLTELSEALQGEDAQGRKVSDISSDSSLQQLKEKVTQSILSKPSRAAKLRSIASIPWKDSGQYIKTIDSAKRRSRQRKAIERFVEVLFKAGLTDDTLDGIRKYIDSLLLTPRKLTVDYLSMPDFIHIYDPNDKFSGGLLKIESVILMNTSLMWRASRRVASNEARLTAINSVIDWVYKNLPSFKDKTLTLVSMGSGHLLMEHLIHCELLRMGVSEDKIQWRCIDSKYQSKMIDAKNEYEHWHNAMTDFKKNKEASVRFFPNENAYLNTQLDDVKLSTSDKEQGPVALLSFVPHCLNEDSGLKPYNTKEDIFVGTVVKDSDFKNANSICLISINGDENGSATLKKIFEPESYQSYINSTIIKAWTDREGTPKISYGCEFRCEQQLMLTTTSLFLEAFNSNHSEITPLEKLKYGFEQICTTLDPNSTGSNLIFLFSDYFVSLNKLNHFFFNVDTDSINFPGVFCELLLDKVKMTKKNDRGEAKGATSS